jgi:hypothetical protein
MRYWCGSGKLWRVFAGVVLLLMLRAEDARPVDWAFSPSISASETYNSNINFTPRDKQSDFITSIKPKFLLTGQTEKDQFSLDSTVSGMIYAKNTDLDRTETYNNAGWVRQWSERFSSDVGANFNKLTAQQTQLQAAGLPAILANQYIYNLRAKGSYALTELVSLSLGGNAGQTWYPEKQYPDSNSAMGNLNLAWKRSEFDTIGLDWAYSYIHYLDTSTDNSQYFRPGLYWQHTFSETASLLIGAGPRFTAVSYYRYVLEFDPELRIAKKLFTNTSNSYDFWATLTKNWSERLSTSLNAGRDQYSDVNAQTFDHMYAGTQIQYGLSDLTTFSCGLRYDYNAEIAQGNQKWNSVSISPSIDRKLTRDLTLRLAGSFQYTIQDYTRANFSQNTDQYLAWVELVWQLPRLWTPK